MALITLKVDETTLAYWQERAAQENLTVEEYMQNLMTSTAQQQEYEDWLQIGLFEGSKGFVGRHADEIINNEWQPDHDD